MPYRARACSPGADHALFSPFSIFLHGRLAKMPSDGIPGGTQCSSIAALLPWQLFAYALTESANSLVASQNLIKKVYFPRLVVPLSSVLSEPS